MTKLTKPQRDVLEWLYCWPGVQIQFADYAGAWAWFMYTWASEEAREQARAIMRMLGYPEEHCERVHTRRLECSREETPRLTVTTLRALIRRGYVRVVAMRPPGDLMAPTFFWQISRKGVDVLMAEMIAADVWELDEPEEITAALDALAKSP